MDFLERIQTFFSFGPYLKVFLDFGGHFSAGLSKQNSTRREKNSEENDLFRSFCSLKNLSGHWAKALRTLRKNFRTGFSKVHSYVSGEPSWEKPTCSETFILYKQVQTLGETLFNFWQKFSCMVLEAPFSLTEYRFQETFLENKLLFNFYWFSTEQFKTVDEKLPQNLSKLQSTRLRKSFRWKKNMWIVTTWFFTSYLVFCVKRCWTFGGKKLDRLVKTTFWTSGELFWARAFFLRKLNFSKFFGNFLEIRRKIFRSLGEVFRRRLSKLHFMGQEKLFEGFYFEVRRNFWPFNGHWTKHFWNVCKIFRHGSQNCIVSVRRMILIRSFVFRQLFLINFSSILGKIVLSVVGSFLSVLSKLPLTN